MKIDKCYRCGTPEDLLPTEPGLYECKCGNEFGIPYKGKTWVDARFSDGWELYATTHFDKHRIAEIAMNNGRRAIRLEKVIEVLWDLLDEVDTAGDLAKGDDKLFRGLAEKAQAKRWATGITVDKDGQDINLENL
jgi:hypothetical protein